MPKEDGWPKKGEVRNPKGRGKGTPNIATLLKVILDKDINRLDMLAKDGVISKKSASIMHHMNSGLIAKALGKDGDPSTVDTKSIEILFDRLEGKAVGRELKKDVEDWESEFMDVDD